MYDKGRRKEPRAYLAGLPGLPGNKTKDSVGHKADDRREKKMSGKREKCVKKNGRKREKNEQK